MRHNTVELFFQPLIKQKGTPENNSKKIKRRNGRQLHDSINHTHIVHAWSYFRS